MDIPADVQLKSTIRAGSVYYFPAFSKNRRHFFIVMNIDPLNDSLIYLLCSSEQIQKVRDRNWGSPSETLVEISPREYKGFTARSIVDCNKVHKQPLNQLIGKLSKGDLELLPKMSDRLVEKLRKEKRLVLLLLQLKREFDF